MSKIYYPEDERVKKMDGFQEPFLSRLAEVAGSEERPLKFKYKPRVTESLVDRIGDDDSPVVPAYLFYDEDTRVQFNSK